MRFLLLALVAAVSFAQAPGDLRALVRDSMASLDPAKTKTNDYAWEFSYERKEFDSAGAIKKQESRRGERTFQEGQIVSRVRERDGQPLSSDESRKQEETIRKRLAEYRSMSLQEQERRKRKEAENMAWVTEIADALDYKYVGEENVKGRPAYVLTCSPRPGYVAKNMRARVLEKTNGKLWIDKADRELAKAEGETFDSVNIGFGLLGRVDKGTRFALSRVRIANGVWVLASQDIRFGARVALVKWVSNELNFRYWNHRHKSQLAQR